MSSDGLTFTATYPRAYNNRKNKLMAYLYIVLSLFSSAWYRCLYTHFML